MQDALRLSVRAHFRAAAAQYGLSADAVDVTYVLNWGGFVNYSYHISDGQRSYHLKLAVTEDARAALQRWYTLRAHLADYHAPNIVDWIDLDGAAGPLFDVVPGSVPTLAGEVLDALVPTLGALFTDDVLARALARDDATTATARDAYLDSFHRRFTEDLRAVAATPPPFVSEDVLQWMQREVRRLHDAVAEASSFDEPLRSAVHGDLWLNNIHWVNPHEWYLLDWDDVAIGDPAADIAALTGPSAQDLRPLKMIRRAQAALSAAEQARLPLLGRATLLDWVIDPLADWLDAPASRAHTAVVRIEKERVHWQALARYRVLYG